SEIAAFCAPQWQAVVETVIEKQIRYYRQKRQGQQKVNQLLRGLFLFYCQGLTQTEIAQQLGLNNQSAVSRLLKLSELYPDISRNMLDYLTKSVSEFAYARRSPDKLHDLEQRVAQFLQPHVEQLVNQAKKEGFNSQSRSMECQVSQTICNYVQTKRGSYD
ncbi:MAG: hypothetical protein AAF959_13625, partial [Cyanobacteria bacterium P01_D01_bin.56]